MNFKFHDVLNWDESKTEFLVDHGGILCERSSSSTLGAVYW